MDNMHELRIPHNNNETPGRRKLSGIIYQTSERNPNTINTL